MKDFGLQLLFFAEIIIGLSIAVVFIVRFRLLKYCKISAQESLIPFKTKDLPFYYSSYAVKQECVRHFFHLPPDINSVLMQEATNDILQAVRYTYTGAVRNEKYNQLLRIYLYSLMPYWHSNARGELKYYRLPWFAPKYYRALYYSLWAQTKLYETDMQSASQYASKALNLFHKLGFRFEQGDTYLLLAQIYRITGIYDVAYTMLKEAEKCFTEVQFSAKIAETTAYMGLLELSRENYEEAAKTLQKASDIAKKNNLTRTLTDIANWQGLTDYLSGKMQKAEAYFKTAYKNPASREGQAYAAEMLARIMLKTENLQEALHYINKALSIGKNLHNKEAEPENLYLKAEILHQMQKNGQSAQILTNLIRKKLPASSTFYKANAYTMLGLIKLQRNELETAKTLFKQALDLEHSKDRLKGAAVDYNNLAEIAFRQGNTAEAQTYLKQAVAYAEDIGDEELKTYLKAKLN